MLIENELQGDDLLQWVADNTRVLKAGLRSNDEETVLVALKQISERFGEDFAEKAFVGIVNRMIEEEGFSFVNKE